LLERKERVAGERERREEGRKGREKRGEKGRKKGRKRGGRKKQVIFFISSISLTICPLFSLPTFLI
jgi:hypothetical protein